MDETTAPAPGDGPVRVVAHQAYDLNVTVHLVPARDIPAALRPGCQPRQGAGVSGPFVLPDATRKWVLAVNRQVVEWLAKSEENQRAFAADPVAALARAGVSVDRAQAKALAALRERAGSAVAAAPGLQLRSVRTKVRPGGQVRAADGGRDDWRPPELGGGDCGCDHADTKGG